MDALALIEVTHPDAIEAQHGAAVYLLGFDVLVARLRTWIRPGDDLEVEASGRIRVHLKGLKQPNQVLLATKMLGKMTNAALDVSGTSMHMQVTAGFACSQDADAPASTWFPQTLVRAASALAYARRENRPFHIYDERNGVARGREQQLIARLQQALDLGEFVLFFHPKVHARYRNVVGVEALIRWAFNDRTLVTPDKFIPVAERHAIIKPITLWAMKSAIARASRWDDSVGVSVNVPPNVMQDEALLSNTRDALELHGVDPTRLTLEVTEGVLAHPDSSVRESLAAFRDLGCRISLDDFGTGYSSLSYFRDLPADELKIDKGFVQPMLQSAADAQIVRTVIELAKTFSLRVVAEGVEDEATAGALTDLGCDQLQGYLIDPPLTVDDLELRHHLTDIARRRTAH